MILSVVSGWVSVVNVPACVCKPNDYSVTLESIFFNFDFYE